jgi:hypothetical protein
MNIRSTRESRGIERRLADYGMLRSDGQSRAVTGDGQLGRRGRVLSRTPFRVGDVVVVKLTREETRTRLQGDEEPRLLEACVAGTYQKKTTGSETVSVTRPENSLMAALTTAALEAVMPKGELTSLAVVAGAILAADGTLPAGPQPGCLRVTR